MSGDGGAQYIEAWLSRLRMRRQKDAGSVEEADRMRREDSESEFKERLLALLVLIAFALAVYLFR